jgi:hypothetical protein
MTHSRLDRVPPEPQDGGDKNQRLEEIHLRTFGFSVRLDMLQNIESDGHGDQGGNVEGPWTRDVHRQSMLSANSLFK